MVAFDNLSDEERALEMEQRFTWLAALCSQRFAELRGKRLREEADKAVS